MFYGVTLVNGSPWFFGSITFSGSVTATRFLGDDGSAALPTFSFTNYPASGFFIAAANQVGFASAGTRSLTFGASGLITGSGTETIQLNGSNITLTPSGTGLVSMATNAVVGSATANPLESGGTVAYHAVTQTGGGYANLQLASSATAGASLLGSVGFGSLGASSGNKAAAAINVIADGNISGVQAAGHLQFYTRAPGSSILERARITSNGNLLLGLTTNGTGVLQFPTHTTTAGGIALSATQFIFTSAADRAFYQAASNPSWAVGTGSGDTAAIYITRRTSDSGNWIDSNGAVPLILRTNSTAALTLDSSQRTIAAGLICGVGATAAHPAFKRNGAEWQSRLADDSGFTFTQTKLRGSDGTAGANFNGAIANITVVDGVVTAVS